MAWTLYRDVQEMVEESKDFSYENNKLDLREDMIKLKLWKILIFLNKKNISTSVESFQDDWNAAIVQYWGLFLRRVLIDSENRKVNYLKEVKIVYMKILKVKIPGLNRIMFGREEIPSQMAQRIHHLFCFRFRYAQ